jgi:phosphomannomutase / phosphoglucomutase
MVSLLASTGKKLSELVDQLPRREIIKDKIATTEGKKILLHIKTVYSKEKIDETDGVKIFKGNAWALVRASGTEPIVRIIIDADTKAEGKEFHSELKVHVHEALGG